MSSLSPESDATLLNPSLFASRGWAAAWGASSLAVVERWLTRHWVATIGDLRVLCASAEWPMVARGLPAVCVDALLALVNPPQTAYPRYDGTPRGSFRSCSESLHQVHSPNYVFESLCACASRPVHCWPRFEGDTHGLLFWLGSRGGRTVWHNPAASGLVTVRASGWGVGPAVPASVFEPQPEPDDDPCDDASAGRTAPIALVGRTAAPLLVVAPAGVGSQGKRDAVPRRPPVLEAVSGAAA